LNAVFEGAFVKVLRRHSAIKKDVERKVRQIMEHPVEYGEPLKGNFQGFYSASVKRNFILI
jgi:mRNA-degrading endonuclease YafQ of YafQ-DinJ toxin-antitoxin module